MCSGHHAPSLQTHNSCYVNKKKNSRMSLYLTQCASSSGPASSSSPVFPPTSCRCPLSSRTDTPASSARARTNRLETRARTHWQLARLSRAATYPARHRSSCFSQLSEFRHTRVKSRLRVNTWPPRWRQQVANHILFIKPWSTVTSPCTKTPITPPPLHLVVWKMEDRLQRVISTKNKYNLRIKRRLY